MSSLGYEYIHACELMSLSIVLEYTSQTYMNGLEPRGARLLGCGVGHLADVVFLDGFAYKYGHL